MSASHYRTNPRHGHPRGHTHRTLMHPRRGACRVPIEHVSGSVTVSVHAEADEPPAVEPTPEWRTETWKYRVEAEAVRHLEHSLRGLGGVR